MSTRRVASCRDARMCTRCRYPAMYSVTRSVDIHTHTHLTLPSTFVIPTCYAHPSFQSLRSMEQDIRRRRASPLVIVLLSKPRTDVSLPPVPQHLQTINLQATELPATQHHISRSPRSVPSSSNDTNARPHTRNRHTCTSAYLASDKGPYREIGTITISTISSLRPQTATHKPMKSGELWLAFLSWTWFQSL